MSKPVMYEKIKKYLSKENLFIMILVGVLLLVAAIPVKEEKNNDGGESTVLSEEIREETEDDYIREMEKRLEEILSKVEGAGEVQVMITLKSSEEKVIELERQSSVSSTVETDAQGGSRTIRVSENHPKAVYRTENSASEPYVIKVNSPQMEGVLVVAQGAGRGTMDRTLSGIVQTLFGLEAHRVRVVRMEISGT